MARIFRVCGDVVHVFPAKLVRQIRLFICLFVCLFVCLFFCWIVSHSFCHASGFPVLRFDWKNSVPYQQPNPRGRLQFVSCTSNLWDRMSDSRKYIEFLQRSILSLQDPQRKSQSWNKPNLLCCDTFPHDNIACYHSCSECIRSHELSVC